MKPKNFAFVVGAAVLAAFVLCMAVSCGTPDCPCDRGDSDWFDVYYAECVDLCEVAATEWARKCGQLPLRHDCVWSLWGENFTLKECAFSADCYRTMTADERCWYVEDGWIPSKWGNGCQ